MQKTALLVVLVGGIGCGSPLTGGEREPSAADSCAEVQAWIEGRDRLPDDYDTIVALPDQYRRAIFSAQTPEVQSALWRTRFERYPAMTAEQADVLESAALVATPELFASDESAVVVALRDLESRAAEAFGADEARALLTQLSSAEDSIVAVSLPFCICNTQADYCLRLGTKCTHGVIACTWLARGCGHLFAMSCNGFCT